MFLLFVLLLVPLPLMANTPLNVCSQYSNDQNLCNHTAGCWYKNNFGCVQCPAGKYCPNTEPAPQPCPTDTFPSSELGATSANECYKDTANGGCVTSDGTTNPQCGLFHPNSIPKCWDNNGEYSTDYHTEPSGGETCYANYLTCSYFTNNNCDSGATISGTARFYPSEREWDIDNCQCGATQFTDNINKFCIGVSNGTSPTVRWIDLVTDYINYAGTSTGYYCTRCIPDNGNTKYYANTTFSDGTQCSPNTAQGRVCKCETSNEMGYWRQGTCNSNTNWTNANNICQRVECGAGQTTDTILPDTANDCHFGDETSLCDDAGCVKLKNILPGINANQWVSIIP